jgi:hypothetical protein
VVVAVKGLARSLLLALACGLSGASGAQDIDYGCAEKCLSDNQPPQRMTQCLRYRVEKRHDSLQQARSRCDPFYRYGDNCFYGSQVCDLQQVCRSMCSP